MKVYTRLENPRITRNELKFAAYFIMGYLVDESLHNTITLTIVSKKYIHEGRETFGITIPQDKRRPFRNFRVHVDPSLPRSRQLIVISHELVHVKQFVKGELGWADVNRPDGKNITYWMKTPFVENDVEDWDLPWEIEANGREYGLYKRYSNFIAEHPEYLACDIRTL